MSLGYSVFVELDFEYTQKNIRYLLDKGSTLGYVYYKFYYGELKNDTPFTVDQALTSINNGYPEKDMRCIVIKIDTTYVALDIMSYGNNIALMFSDFYYPWLKNFIEHDDTDIDIGRYTKVMIEWVSDCKIECMKIEND